MRVRARMDDDHVHALRRHVVDALDEGALVVGLEGGQRAGELGGREGAQAGHERGEGARVAVDLVDLGLPRAEQRHVMLGPLITRMCGGGRRGGSIVGGQAGGRAWRSARIG